METKEILDGITDIGKKVDQQKSDSALAIKEVKEANEKKFLEAENLRKEYEKKQEDQVKQFNEDMAAQGKSLKEIAEGLETLKKKQGKLGSGPGGKEFKSSVDAINELIETNFDKIKEIKESDSLRFKAAGNITISNVTNLSGSFVNTPMQYGQEFYIRPTRKVQIRDLVSIINTNATAFIYYRQPVTGLIGQGSFGFQGGQGSVKAALDYNLQPVVVTPDYLAGTARVAKQMLNDLPSLQSFLSGQLIEDYRRSESNAFVPQLVAAATAFTPTSAVTAEKIVQGTADLLARDWDPNGIVTDGPTWAKLMNTRPTDYGLPGGGLSFNIDASGNARFLGMPIVIQNNMPASQIIIGDFTKAAIVQSEGLSVAFFDQDQDNVIRNLITARVEARVAFTVMRPDAFDFFGNGTT